MSNQKHRANNRPRIWGKHAVTAALANPNRTFRQIWAVRDGLADIDVPSGLPVHYAEAADLARLVARDALHQGIVLECDPLPEIWLSDVLSAEDRGTLLVLDQVTDPHNVGAILRSAAAFDVTAIITQDRHAPPESGALARAASGALELVPWVRVTNLSRALDEIAEAGYWRIGLDGEADQSLAQALGPAQIALVAGAEGSGLRPNTAAHCDQLARLPISAKIESLNVSNAVAIALYAVACRAVVSSSA